MFGSYLVTDINKIDNNLNEKENRFEKENDIVTLRNNFIDLNNLKESNTSNIKESSSDNIANIPMIDLSDDNIDNKDNINNVNYLENNTNTNIDNTDNIKNNNKNKLSTLDTKLFTKKTGKGKNRILYSALDYITLDSPISLFFNKGKYKTTN